MAARKRLKNEKFARYRKKLKQEARELKLYLMGFNVTRGTAQSTACGLHAKRLLKIIENGI